MKTLEAITISKKIVDNVNKNKSQLIEDMTKNGFVSVDNTIKQYNPRTYDFNNASYDDLKEHINSCIKNKWGIVEVNQIISELEQELPQLTEREIKNFKSYIEQYQMEINTELIETRLKEVLNEYNPIKDIKVTINNGRDIANQLIIMKQNNIFTDTKTRYLYKYKDGDFQIYKLNDLMGLFNSYLSNEDIKIKPSDVQRNRKTYLTSLDDIHDIRVELNKKKEKTHILNTYEDDYKKILKILKKY